VRHFKEHWLPYLLGVITFIVILYKVWPIVNRQPPLIQAATTSLVPDVNLLSNSPADELIRYGKRLIDSTSIYFGPRGLINRSTNGLTCQNCHRESGTKLFTNNFLGVAKNYPKYRPRSGRIESIEFRVNECFQRSLNGAPLDSLAKEMHALVAYIKWVGKNAHYHEESEGIKTAEVAYLPRAASPVNGRAIYSSRCQSCHGQNGQGQLTGDSTWYVYPPLWGPNSYTTSAGMFRLSRLASFVKYNMPLGATYNLPQLSDEEAWDVAAFINSQPHPVRTFAYDWPQISSKPPDYPFGPYTDNFPEKQHKYGPFEPIKNARAK
jgi:thiosulfate dehydrogenase